MGIWNRIFQSNDRAEVLALGQFGRFSDAYKPAERYGHWDEAVRHFDRGEFKDALSRFFAYLQNDDGDNTVVDEQSRNFDFQLIQGSKKIIGFCVEDRLIVTATLVKADAYSTGLLRRLLEKNYALNYCRYALDENNQLTVVFDSFIQDANPYKLYFGLKELAIEADKMDDLILSEFKDMLPHHAGHTRQINEQYIGVKEQFYLTQLQVLKNDVEDGYLKKTRDPNVIIYAVLSTFYKIDYLLTPHGRSTEIIEKAHKEYFADSTRPVELRVSSLMTALDELLLVSSDELRRELYEVIYTFGINPPIDLYQAHASIQTEIKKSNGI